MIMKLDTKISHFFLPKVLTKGFCFDIIYKLTENNDSLAQVVEHMTFNHGVPGSIPG